MANAENPAVAEQGKKLLSVEGGVEVASKAAISALIGFVAGSVLAIAIPALPAVAAVAVTFGIGVAAVIGAYYKIKALRKELKANAAKPPEQQNTRAYIYTKHISQIVGALAGGGVGYEVNVLSGVTGVLSNAEQGVTQAANLAGAAVISASAKVIGVEAAAAKVGNILPSVSAEPGGIIQASVSTDGSTGTQVASADDAGGSSEGDGEQKLSARELQAIAEAKEALPEHAKYVDERGKFDIRECGRDLYNGGNGKYSDPGEAMTRAREMNTEWKAMLDEKGSRIV